jgi:hypothetical protein
MEDGESDLGRELWQATVRHVRDDIRLRRASDADRIALARELLAGTGRVVAPINPAPLRDGEMLIRAEMRVGDQRCDYNRIVPMVMDMNAPGAVISAEAADVAIRVFNACRAAMMGEGE